MCNKNYNNSFSYPILTNKIKTLSINDTNFRKLLLLIYELDLSVILNFNFFIANKLLILILISRLLFDKKYENFSLIRNI